jgi:hypothetical protein
MSACSTILTPPYGYYVRLLFGKGQSIERDLMLTQQNKNFRSGGKGRLHYLGWDRQILGDNYSRSSEYSSQGRSWPTGISYHAPHSWQGQLILNPSEWNLLNDIFKLQQESMKAGLTEQDILLYDHRIMFREPTPITRPQFDTVGAIAAPGTYEYWALFRSELKKPDLKEMYQNSVTGIYQYLVDIELTERIPALTALP